MTYHRQSDDVQQTLKTRYSDVTKKNKIIFACIMNLASILLDQYLRELFNLHYVALQRKVRHDTQRTES